MRLGSFALLVGGFVAVAAACGAPPTQPNHDPPATIAIAPQPASTSSGTAANSDRDRSGDPDPDRAPPNEEIPAMLARGWKAWLAGRTTSGIGILKQAVARIEHAPVPPHDTRGRLPGVGVVDNGVLIDGTNLAVLEGRHQLLLVDVSTAIVQAILPADPNPGFSRAVRGLPFVVFPERHTLRIVEVKERELIPVTTWTMGGGSSWAVAPDGNMVVLAVENKETGGSGSPMRVDLVGWSTRERRETVRLSKLDGPLHDLHLVDDNRVVVFDREEKESQVIDLATGKMLFAQAGVYETIDPAFSGGDRRWVAYVAPSGQPRQHPSTVVLADRATGKVLTRSTACPSPVTVAFDPKSPLLAVGTTDSVCFLEAPSLRVAAAAVRFRAPSPSPVTSSSYSGARSRINLDILGGRVLFAHRPTDDESAIIELPNRSVAFQGVGSMHVERDGSRVGLSHASSNPEAFTVNEAGALVRKPWTGPLRSHEMRDEVHRVSFDLTRLVSKRLCKVNSWIVPKEACDP